MKEMFFALFVLFVLLPQAAQAAPNRAAKRFRLGTAALPFGWSTAVGNLDSDEKPDFAIADRTGSRSQGYDYSLELNLSLEQSQVFHFHSPHSALTVSILDLDNDRDLDVVLTQAVSGEVAGVWINNGSGEFHQGNAADFRDVEIGGRNHIHLDNGNGIPVIAGLPLRKFAALAGEPIQFRAPPVSVSSFAALSGAGVASSPSHRNITSRGPPQLVL